MNKNLTLEAKITHLEHLLEVVLKNQEQIKKHLWKGWNDEKGEHGLDKPSGKNTIKFQEQEAEEYFNNNVLPKLEAKTRGELMAEGFFDGILLKYLKTQALIFIGTILKKVVIQDSVDLAKWLITEAEKVILTLYNKSTVEEKEAFKEKIKEVFPESELLKKLG